MERKGDCCPWGSRLVSFPELSGKAAAWEAPQRASQGVGAREPPAYSQGYFRMLAQPSPAEKTGPSATALLLVKKGAGQTTFFCRLLLPESPDRYQLPAKEIPWALSAPGLHFCCQQGSLPSSFDSKACTRKFQRF